MEYRIYKAIDMVALEKCGKWSLFYYESYNGNDSLSPVEFAQNQTRLEVHEHDNLVITTNTVYSLNGEKLMDHHNDVQLIELPGKVLITAAGGTYGRQLLIWDKRKVLFTASCTEFRYTNRYLALNYRTVWSLFLTDGKSLDEGAFQADDVEIHNDLLIVKNLGKQDLYSLSKTAFIKKDQTRIICSDYCELALCARIGDSSLSVLCNGRWHQIPDVSEFNLVDGMGHIFYVKRGDKYFLYENMHRFMRRVYPNGFDFVACQNGILLIINDGEPCFYSQVC